MSLVKNAGIGPAYYMPTIKEICKFPYMSFYRKRELGTIGHNIFMKYVEVDDFQSIISDVVTKVRGTWKLWQDTLVFFEDGALLFRSQYNLAGLQLRYAFFEGMEEYKSYYNNYYNLQYAYYDIFFKKGTTHKIIAKKLLEDYRNRVRNGAVI